MLAQIKGVALAAYLLQVLQELIEAGDGLVAEPLKPFFFIVSSHQLDRSVSQKDLAQPCAVGRGSTTNAG